MKNEAGILTGSVAAENTARYKVSQTHLMAGGVYMCMYFLV